MIATMLGLDELKSLKQWVCWEQRRKKKIPINPRTGEPADPTDSATWASYDEAIEAKLESDSLGLGFVFSEDDGFAGVDLDDCIKQDTGELEEWAQEIVSSLDSYTEVSPSGKGLKIWIRGTKPNNDNSRTGKVEIYDSNRYFTFTGDVWSDKDIEYRQEQLDDLYWRLFPVTENEEKINTVGYKESRATALDDATLLEKARNNKATGEKFKRLYDNGDTGAYKGDHSRADFALCGHLAFWTACDEEQMDRLFRGSRLMRQKWDSRRGNCTYGEQTIAKAIKGCRNVYSPAKYMSRVQEVVEAAMEIVLDDAWGGRSGPTDRDVYKALIYTVGRYGHVEADGSVTVRASTRDLAWESGIRRPTIREALKRLEKSQLIVRLEKGSVKRASKYTLILTQKRPITNNRVNTYGSVSSQTTRIRNSSPSYGTIGKRNGQIIELVHTSGSVVTLEEIARRLNARKNNIKKRNIPLLLELGFLELRDDGFVTPPDLEERLEKEYQMSGQKRASDLQKARYDNERKAQRDRQRDYTNRVNQEESDVTLQFGYCEDGYLHSKGCPLHLPEIYEEKQRARRMEVAA